MTTLDQRIGPLDMVIVHKTVPDTAREVSEVQFFEVVDLLVAARCGQTCPAR